MSKIPMHGDFSGEALVPMSKLTGDLGRDAPPTSLLVGAKASWLS